MGNKKGSQRLLQDLVESEPKKFLEEMEANGIRDLKWLSPLKSDEYAEYRDGRFLCKFELEKHHSALRDFWPTGGPRWDGLAKGVGVDGKPVYVLVEAKANIPEIKSSCKAKPESRKRIKEALKTTRESLLDKKNIGDLPESWTHGYYQYANRLAYLYFMNEIAKEKTFLALVYFINDQTHKPTTREAWNKALALQKERMGLTGTEANEKKILEFFV